MSYLLVGLYTWPRTSRVLVLTIGTLIFVYEFIFKSQAPQATSGKLLSQKEWVLYTSLIPFVCGVGALVALALDFPSKELLFSNKIDNFIDLN